jgi:hypothetical protein
MDTPKRAAFVAAATFLYLTAGRARAHTIGLSTGEYTARSRGLRAELAFARVDVADSLPNLDANGDGFVTAEEMRDGRQVIEDRIVGRIHVTRGGARCSSSVLGATLNDQRGLDVTARFDCPAGEAGFEVEVVLLDDLLRGHMHVVHAVGATSSDKLLYRGHARFEIEPPATEVDEAAEAVTSGSPAAPAAATAPSTPVTRPSGRALLRLVLVTLAFGGGVLLVLRVARGGQRG